jgi:hypothetical protein
MAERSEWPDGEMLWAESGRESKSRSGKMRMWAKYIVALYIVAQALHEHICTGVRAELTFPTIDAAISTDKICGSL